MEPFKGSRVPGFKGSWWRAAWGRAASPCLLMTLVLLLVAAGPVGAQVPAGEWPSERPPEPLPAPDVRFPAYEVRMLPNGLQVMVVPHHEQPALSVRMLIKAGASQDPAGKGGVARLLASLLDQGTTTKSALEIASTIDSIGGGLGAGASSDLTFVSAVVMEDSFQLVMDLLGDIVRRPAFAAAEIERQRQQALSGFQVSLTDPDYVAEMVFDRLVYGFSPYSVPESGTPDSVVGITRDDLVEFHETYFVPNNAIIGVVGDVTTDEAFAAVERVFGGWESAELPERDAPEPPEPTRRLVVIDKPGAVQTEIRAGHIAIPRQHPDYMAVNLAVKILGGEGANRLHRVLRSERALTYGAAADLTTLRFGGDVEAETNTRSETSTEALRLMVDEFWRLQRERVGTRELADAQAYLTGHFPLTIETPTAIAQQVLNVLFYGLDLAELDTFRERVNAVDVDEIQRVARQYLKPDRLSIVMVGDASTFIDELPRLGFGRYELIPIADLDLEAPNLGGPGIQGPAHPEARDASSALADVAMAIIERAISAKGGADALRSVRTVAAAGTTTLATPQGPVRAETMTYIDYPDRFRVEATLPDGEVTQTFSAGDAWVSDPDGVRDATADMRVEFQGSVNRDLVKLLPRAAAGEVTVRLLEPVEIDGRQLDALELSGADLDPVTLLLDRASGVVARQRYRSGPGGELVEEEFFDYRAVDGLQVAFRSVVRRDGDTLVERIVREFQFNVPIAPALFERPAH